MRTEAEIAADIKALVTRYTQEQTEGVTALKETVDYMIETVLCNITQGREQVEDAITNKLPLEQLEAEGYVRACLTIKAEFAQWSDNLRVMLEKHEASLP